MSKIEEELQEAIDAAEQGNSIMVLLELSDMVGAIEAYVAREFGGKFNLDSLRKMASATKRAFDSGHRS